MFSLLPCQKINEEVPKLIPVLLGLYRRNVNPYPVTQCLSAVLHVALTQNRNAVEPLLDNLLNIMFDLVSRMDFMCVYHSSEIALVICVTFSTKLRSIVRVYCNGGGNG